MNSEHEDYTGNVHDDTKMDSFRFSQWIDQWPSFTPN